MKRDEFAKELSKYSKESIINYIYTRTLYDSKKVLNEVRWNDIQLRFEKLMAESESIRNQMKPFIGNISIESFGKYMKLMEQDNKIQSKIDAVMKEMDTHTKYKEVGC